MKKTLIVLTFLILILINGTHIFALLHTTEHDGLEGKLKTYLQEGFEVRTNILNNLLIQNDYDSSDIERKLRQHIKDPLLTSDIETFLEIYREGRCFDAIISFDIRNVKIKSQDEKYAKIIATILWEMQGSQQIYFEENNYLVKMQYLDEKWFINDYSLYR